MTEIELSKKIKKKKGKKSKKKKEIKNEKEENDGEEISLKDEKKRKRSDSGDTMESDEKHDTNQSEEKGETTSPVVKSDEKEEENISEMKEGKEKKKILTKEERKLKKAEIKAEKERLLSKVPKTDEDGISYTKVQIKRMLKRVKRGLDPVPTEEEERERARQIKADKYQEEKELAGILYTKETEDKRSNDGEEEQNDVDMEQEENDNNGEDDVEEERKQETEEEDQEEHNQSYSTDNIQRSKKKARTKVVPSDYVCMACNNKNQPLHWIYDCPDKIHKPGANKLKKSLRGLHDPASRKVFISGLPFDARTKEVEMYFEKEMKCGKVVQCKLLQFEDTKRCRGTGFLTFESDEGAKKALKLNGTVLTLSEQNKKDEKKKKSANNNVKKQKELRLGVKKLMNRAVTQRSRY